MLRRLLALCVCLVLTSACGDKSPAAPTSPQLLDLSGEWNGSLTVEGATARMTWTLSQTDAIVSGPVLVVLPNGIVLLNGALTGTVAGSGLTYAIAVSPGGIPTQPDCVGQLGGTMTAATGTPSTLTGNYAVRSSSCTTPFTGGNLTLTKQ